MAASKDDMTRSQVTRQARNSPKVIYIVDDNALLVEYAGTVLKSEGYEVKYFTDPKAVVQAMREARPKPAAIVTDYDMGEMNGLDLIVSLHKIHPSLKTLLLSGTIDRNFIARHPAKVHKFLGKPYQPAQLKRIVGELLLA